MALPSFIRKLLYSKQSTAYIWQLRHKYEQTGSSVLKWYYFRKYLPFPDETEGSLRQNTSFPERCARFLRWLWCSSACSCCCG